MKYFLVLTLILSLSISQSIYAQNETKCNIQSVIKNIDKEIDQIMGNRHTHGELITRNFDFKDSGLYDLRRIESMYTKTYVTAGILSLIPIAEASFLLGSVAGAGGIYLNNMVRGVVMINGTPLGNAMRRFVVDVVELAIALGIGATVSAATTVSYSGIYLSAIIRSVDNFESGFSNYLDVSEEDIMMAEDEIEKNHEMFMRDLNWNYNSYMEREKETGPIDDVVEKRRDMQATILMMEAKVDALSLKKKQYEYLFKAFDENVVCEL